ncbi:preprotein translocase subunit SecF [Corynebacterium occultum]|uniref:Protein-export membrane protein SecF n=1 Tax=Corynebacterium occultum TaxID=2675219 RepID=A0A6B8W9M6_9CORY|nr:protein translocase subunit SecF [Corynebacterium occultum]QGU07546.1 preprotein translocase subunit SecF [Corynebacterium occultum]
MSTDTKKKGSTRSLYSDTGGIDFIGRSKLWYWITVALLVISILAIAIRGFSLSIDFEGGTKMTMPAADLVVEQVEDTFVEATGVEPELTQIVGSGDGRTLEITTERLNEDQITDARLAIFEEFQPLDTEGNPSPDAVGDSTVSESWGSTITQRMLIAMVVFLLAAFAYIAFRLQRAMAAAAMIALAVDGVLIAGIYAVFGFEVSPATVIGLLTVLSFSIYDTVIVFDKVRENTAGLNDSTRRTYGEQANLAVNQTVVRSISTSVISALPIIALMVVAVWMLGVGTLRDLALIQLIGVIQGIFSSIFLATPLLVTIHNRSKEARAHNARVSAARTGKSSVAEVGGGASGEAGSFTSEESETTAKRTIVSPVLRVEDDRPRDEGPSGSVTWRPGR